MASFTITPYRLENRETGKSVFCLDFDPPQTSFVLTRKMFREMMEAHDGVPLPTKCNTVAVIKNQRETEDPKSRVWTVVTFHKPMGRLFPDQLFFDLCLQMVLQAEELNFADAKERN